MALFPAVCRFLWFSFHNNFIASLIQLLSHLLGSLNTPALNWSLFWDSTFHSKPLHSFVCVWHYSFMEVWSFRSVSCNYYLLHACSMPRPSCLCSLDDGNNLYLMSAIFDEVWMSLVDCFLYSLKLFSLQVILQSLTAVSWKCDMLPRDKLLTNLATSY